MDIKYEIEPVFKIEFFKIKCVEFKQKKLAIEKVLDKYPETPQTNFYSNRNKAEITRELRDIFKHEFNLISTKFNNKYFCKELGQLHIIRVIITYHTIMVHKVMQVLFIYNKEKTHQELLIYNLGIMKRIEVFYTLLKLNRVIL